MAAALALFGIEFGILAVLLRSLGLLLAIGSLFVLWDLLIINKKFEFFKFPKS